MKNLSDLSSAGIEKEVLKGKMEFDKIQSIVQESVENNIPLIMGNINKTGKKKLFVIIFAWVKYLENFIKILYNR